MALKWAKKARFAGLFLYLTQLWPYEAVIIVQQDARVKNVALLSHGSRPGKPRKSVVELNVVILHLCYIEIAPESKTAMR